MNEMGGKEVTDQLIDLASFVYQMVYISIELLTNPNYSLRDVQWKLCRVLV